MKNKFFLLFLITLFSFCSSGQLASKGPYTITAVSDGVYHIEDSNESNPAGVHTDSDGNVTGMNNCSDMYLLTGRKKALLVDLSNTIKWDSSATESLRSVVYDRVGEREFFITVTHRHGDHLGMLPAFHDDQKAKFWIPAGEFTGMNIFPSERTTFFSERDSLDLGGMMINTLEIQGHTPHSTLFFLKGRNMVFTGDAIGSGSGVWLFNYESFSDYSRAIDNLIRYIEDPVNNIDIEGLTIYGGHAWQKGTMAKLTASYIYDMQELIELIGSGKAEYEPMPSPRGYLDTNFRYGTATITWNREGAAKYAGSSDQQNR